MPTIPAVVLPKVLFPQSDIMAAFVHSNSSRLSDVSSCLPTYNKHNITKLNFYSVQPLPSDPLTLLPQNVQLPTHSRTFNLPHHNVLITLFTNYKYWIVVEWNSRCRFILVFEMVYWRWIGISVIIVIDIIFIKLRIN